MSVSWYFPFPEEISTLSRVGALIDTTSHHQTMTVDR